MNLKFFVGGMMLMAAPAFAANECPDISGHWVGVCTVDSSGASAGLQNLRPLLQKAEENLQIKMVGAPNPLACRLLTVGDRTYAIGGKHDERFEIPYDEGKSLSVTYSETAAWDLPKGALATSATGRVDVEGKAVPFEVQSRYELRANGHLYRTDESKGEGFDIKVNCEYQRQS